MSEEAWMRLVGAVLLLSAFGISGYYRRKAELGGREDDVDVREEKGWVYRVRTMGALLGYGAMLAYLIYPPLVAWGQVDVPSGVRWAGAGAVLLMLPAIYWLFSSLGKNVTPTVSIREEHQLVTEGPYRYIRHPLYTFGFIAMVGMAVLAANWFILAMLLVAMTAIFARTQQEEEKLIERFGDEYVRYMERTGRYLPRL